jgi:hypothetical protein
MKVTCGNYCAVELKFLVQAPCMQNALQYNNISSSSSSFYRAPGS